MSVSHTTGGALRSAHNIRGDVMNRATTYTLDVIINTLTGEDEIKHDKMDFEDLMTILDGYVMGTNDETTSMVFSVVRHLPKDWVVLCDPDHEAECFGPFPERDKAIEWAKMEFGTDTDWVVRAIDLPFVGSSKPKANAVL